MRIPIRKRGDLLLYEDKERPEETVFGIIVDCRTSNNWAGLYYIYTVHWLTDRYVRNPLEHSEQDIIQWLI